jgi:hypothetical protein
MAIPHFFRVLAEAFYRQFGTFLLIQVNRATWMKMATCWRIERGGHISHQRFKRFAGF